MRSISALRATIRFAGAAALISLAACADNAPTGGDASVVALKNGGASRVEIVLTAPAGAPYAAAKGKAKYSTSNPELQIEAENIPTGTAVTFMLGSTQVGSGTADAFRKVRLNLVGAAAPRSVTGMGVSVKRASDAATIVSGNF